MQLNLLSTSFEPLDIWGISVENLLELVFYSGVCSLVACLLQEFKNLPGLDLRCILACNPD